MLYNIARQIFKFDTFLSHMGHILKKKIKSLSRFIVFPQKITKFSVKIKTIEYAR